MVNKINKIDLKNLFRNLQSQMMTKLETDTVNILHPVSKGNASELNWINLLNTYLPTRYRVSNAFVIDADGHLSEQIDIVIFDRHFSPFLLNQDGTLYVPAESVYGVIEVKPSLNMKNLKYAGKKALSVRNLKRTSEAIIHAGGTYPPRPLFNILSGIIAYNSDWKPPFGTGFQSVIRSLPKKERLDFGCALKNGAFTISYDKSEPQIETSISNDSLIFFFLNLLARLQIMGSVPAMNIAEYKKSLKK